MRNRKSASWAVVTLLVFLVGFVNDVYGAKLTVLYHVDTASIMPAIERFQAKFPGTEVEIVRPAGDLTDSTIAMHAGGSAPDIYINDAGGGEQPFVLRGMAMALDRYYERDRDHFTDWYPGVFTGVTYYGSRYAVPAPNMSSYALWLNADMFEEAGMATPSSQWTHDDFVAVGKKLSRDRDGDGAKDQWAHSWKSWCAWKTWFFNHGGSFTAEDDPAVITFGDQNTVDSLQWMQDLMFTLQIIPANHLLATDARKAYLEGRVAMSQVGAGFWNTAKEAPFRKAVVLEPIGPSGRRLMTTYWAWMISSQAKQPDLAWELVKCLTDSEMYAEEVKSGNNAFHRRAMQSFFGLSVPVQGYREAFLDYFNYPVFMASPIMAPDAHASIVRVVETVVLRGLKPARVAVAEVVDVVKKQSQDFWGKAFR